MDSATSVPIEAASWIASLEEFRNRGAIEGFRSFHHDLRTFLVPDLKIIFKRMQHFNFAKSSRFPACGSLSSKKKQQLIHLIRRYFYLDPLCTQPDRQALLELTQSIPSNVQTNGNQPHIFPPNNFPPLMHPMPPLQQPNSCFGTLAVAAPSFPVNFGCQGAIPSVVPLPSASNIQQSTAMLSNQHPILPLPFSKQTVSNIGSGALKRSYPDAFGDARAQEVSTATDSSSCDSVCQIDTFSSMSSGSCPSVAIQTKIKHEPNVDETPQNDLEEMLLDELQSMGFTSTREVLASIRKLGPNAATSENVLFDIIKQREDADEARKMDEARLLSELSRKEDARRRRLEIEYQLEDKLRFASVDAWSRDRSMFKDSWMLESSIKSKFDSMILESVSAKKLLISLLKLEKKAFKFYKLLPREYFKGVVERLGRVNVTQEFEEVLCVEINALETGMYKLSEQQGGVPRIFAEAHDQAALNKVAIKGTDYSIEKSTEEEITLVCVVPALLNQNSLSKEGKNRTFELIDVS